MGNRWRCAWLSFRLVALLVATTSTSWAVVYVDSAATSPISDGSSWTTAFRTIQQGVDSAASTRDEVWVSRGYYRENVQMKAGVLLFGGFCGTETSRDSRNWKANPAVIDASRGSAVTAVKDTSIDGFTIRNCAYGIYMSGGSLGVRNITITVRNNTIIASRGGTAVSCGRVTALIENNTIAGGYRGVHCSNSTVIGNKIIGNRVAISSDSGSPTMANNFIAGNFDGIKCSSDSPTITNNTIAWNLRYGIYCSFSTARIANNIIAYNYEGISRLNNAPWLLPSLSHNDVYGNIADYTLVTPAPSDISVDPLLADAESGNFHIQPTSPCVDAGDDYAPGRQAKDIDGDSRRISHIDIGADESTGIVWEKSNRIVYVNKAAALGGNGRSWADAYQTIQAGVDDAARNGGAEVWVAEGMYDEVVNLVPFTYLYGGFQGSESSLSDRRPNDHRAIVRAEGKQTVVWAANFSCVDGFTVRGADTGISCWYSMPTVANNTVTGNSICGIECITGDYYTRSPIVTGNVVAANGKGIYCTNSSPAIVNNTIVGNNREGIGCNENVDSDIYNNIIAFNGFGVAKQKGKAGNPLLVCNDVYGNATDYSNMAPGIGDFAADPVFASCESGDFHIQPQSPCVDAGSENGSPLPVLDMDGQPRLQGDGVDVGADESDGTPLIVTPRILYVNAAATPGGDGTSWDAAYASIREAIDDVVMRGPAEVWVAAGVYNEQVRLQPFARLYGGFVGTESSRDRRDLKHNVSQVNYPVAGGAVRGTNMARLDGFTVGGSDYGVYCSNSSPLITDCHVLANKLFGICLPNYCWAEITGCLITDNGGGISCGEGSPTITNNTIARNGTQGISTGATTAIVANNIVALNGSGICGPWYSGWPERPSLFSNDVYGNGSNYSYLDPGETDIMADPGFVDAAGGDYHIRWDSPCINKGWNAAPGIPTVDIDGQNRFCWDAVDIGADEYLPRSVTIDIKPGEYPNVINKGSQGLVGVAVYSTAGFDATDIDPASVVFAGATVATEGKSGKLHVEKIDVDGDGTLDLILHFAIQSLVVSDTTTELTLTGKIKGGDYVQGTDSAVISQARTFPRRQAEAV